MQIQRISNYQTSYNNSNPAFGLKIKTGAKLKAAIDASPAKDAISSGIRAIEKQFETKPNEFTFEMSPTGVISISSGNYNSVSAVTDITLSKPIELLSAMRTTARAAQ